MKAHGVEIMQFWSEWPPGEFWVYDELAGPGDLDSLVPDKKYDLDEFGCINWAGGPPTDEPHVPFKVWFKRWKKARESRAFFLTVPNKDVDRLRRICEENGWKLL